jgi:hypothetical protein
VAVQVQGHFSFSGTAIMCQWLDTETKAMLQQAPPETLAPPYTGLFTLVLLQKGEDMTRLVRALTRIPGVPPRKAMDLAARHCPLPATGGLSLGDAMLGQFELVCCDSISVFLRNEVVATAERLYLAQLYQQFRRSPEFENVAVTIASVPQTASGEHFVDQFLGEADGIIPRISGPLHVENMMRKKARIMAHWAQKIGAEIAIAENE